MKKMQTHRRYRRPRCLKGQRHRWIMGKALRVSDTGALTSDGEGQGKHTDHLKGVCRKCHKVRHFHPYTAKRRVFGIMAAKRRVA